MGRLAVRALAARARAVDARVVDARAVDALVIGIEESVAGRRRRRMPLASRM